MALKQEEEFEKLLESSDVYKPKDLASGIFRDVGKALFS